MNDLLYLGCTTPSRLPFVEAAARFVLSKLDIRTEEATSACCLEPVGLRSVFADRSEAFQRSQFPEGCDVITVCDGCAVSLSLGGIQTRTFIEVLFDNIDSIRASSKSLERKLAMFPGCHCEDVCARKGKDAFAMMSKILTAIGCEPVKPAEHLCCGGGVASIDDKLSRSILAESIASFDSTGAEAVVTSCPFCFMQFDVLARHRTYHIAELVAEAMGWHIDYLQYHRGR